MIFFMNFKRILHQHSFVETLTKLYCREKTSAYIKHIQVIAFLVLFAFSFLKRYCLIATHIINHLPFPILNNKSSIKLLFLTSPSYDHLRTFSCLCFASTLQQSRTKIDSRARSCVFLGYPFGIKGCKFFLSSNKKKNFYF